MSGSLFDQLKKAGVADKSQVHKARADKQKQAKRQHKQKPPHAGDNADAVEQARREKLERDRRLNAERKAAADRKALAAQIRQLIETHRQDKGVDCKADDGVAYNFVEDNKVKTIYVSRPVQQQLSRGQLAIVRLGEGYELVPIVVADRVLSRDPEWFVTRSKPTEAEDGDEDDPYKDYKIPDDLVW